MATDNNPDFIHERYETLAINDVRALRDTHAGMKFAGDAPRIFLLEIFGATREAQNGLLKILEEPPSHTLFILIAEQISSLPATIMSRCQQYAFCPPELLEPVGNVDYLTIGTFYPQASERAELFKQGISIIDDLCYLLEKKLSPCTLASKWSNYALADLLWFLYLLTAQAIRYQLVDCHTEQPWADNLQRFSKLVEPVDLFQLLDKINSLMNTVQQNITLNQTLAIETLLMLTLRRSS